MVSHHQRVWPDRPLSRGGPDASVRHAPPASIEHKRKCALKRTYCQVIDSLVGTVRCHTTRQEPPERPYGAVWQAIRSDRLNGGGSADARHIPLQERQRSPL